MTFAPKDVISFGGDEFEVIGAENGKVEFYSLSDGVVSEGNTEQLAAQIAGGGSTRLIPGWSRNVEVYGDRDDQQILADLLNHFNNWRTTDGIYVHSDYYNHCVMDRMYNLRVSDNAAENRRNMIYAAYTVHHFFHARTMYIPAPLPPAPFLPVPRTISTRKRSWRPSAILSAFPSGARAASRLCMKTSPSL